MKKVDILLRLESLLNLKLSDKTTITNTDIQAEILVKNKISVEYVKEVIFEDIVEMHTARGAARMIYSQKLPEFVVDESFFNLRY